MMRLYLLPHATSSWKHPRLADRPRPAAGRQRMREQGIDPQLGQGVVVAGDVATATGASVERHPFEPALGGGVAGLPTGRFLGAPLVPGDDGPATGRPGEGVPVLAHVERNLAAGWRGYG